MRPTKTTFLPTASTEPTGRPERVIARYLGRGGAPVDIWESASRDGGRAAMTYAECTGCPAWESWRWETDPDRHLREEVPAAYRHLREDRGEITVSEAAREAENQARAWAQAHAERCRAMPHPDSE